MQLRPRNTSARCPCGRLGVYKVDLEWSWFRGEDTVAWRCDEHKRDVLVKPNSAGGSGA